MNNCKRYLLSYEISKQNIVIELYFVQNKQISKSINYSKYIVMRLKAQFHWTLQVSLD